MGFWNGLRSASNSHAADCSFQHSPEVTWESSSERGWEWTKKVEQGAMVTVPRVELDVGIDASRTELQGEGRVRIP